MATGSRAPRAPTDKAGGFVLRGTHLGGRLLVYWDEGWDEFDRSKYRPGGPMVLRLGKKAEDSEPRYPVSIDAQDAAGRPPKELCRVHLDRLSDGRRSSQEVTITSQSFWKPQIGTMTWEKRSGLTVTMAWGRCLVLKNS